MLPARGDPSRWWLVVLPALVRAALWVSEALRRPWHDRRAAADLAAARRSPGEVLLSYPAAQTNEAAYGVATEALYWAKKGPHGDRFDLTGNAAVESRQRSRELPPLPRLRRAYRLLTIEPGHEDDAIRRVRVFAWMARRLYGIDPRLELVRCPLAHPAAVGRPLKPGTAKKVQFLPAYQDGRVSAGIHGAWRRQVSILVVDQDIDPDVLPEKVQRLGLALPDWNKPKQAFGVTGPTAHGTVVTAIIADLAPKAWLSVLAVPLRPTGDVSLWTLLRALMAEREYDLVNFSWDIADDDHEQRAYLARTFADLSGHGRGPVYVCPTGNAGTGDPIDTIDTLALPARFPSVVAIGALHGGRRSPLSRYGTKDGDHGDEWWLCPGGAEGDPLARYGEEVVHGTSFAAAFATGVLAWSISGLELPHSADAGSLLDLLDQLETTLARDRRNAGLRADVDRIRFKVQSMSTELLSRLRTHSDRHALEDYNAREHGLGRLRVD